MNVDLPLRWNGRCVCCASCPSGGVRLTDIAAAADLDKATALRLLDVMAREGL